MFTKTHLSLRYASIGRFIKTGLKQSSEIYVKQKEKKQMKQKWQHTIRTSGETTQSLVNKTYNGILYTQKLKKILYCNKQNIYSQERRQFTVTD